jgi:hypothetical protein
LAAAAREETPSLSYIFEAGDLRGVGKATGLRGFGHGDPWEVILELVGE